MRVKDKQSKKAEQQNKVKEDRKAKEDKVKDKKNKIKADKKVKEDESRLYIGLFCREEVG